MSRGFTKDPKINSALRHSVKDGVAYSVMTGAGETYFSAFALFLKAMQSESRINSSSSTSNVLTCFNSLKGFIFSSPSGFAYRDSVDCIAGIVPPKD